MAKGGVNKVILIGNLGVDPDVRYSPNGSAVTNIRIATSESWKDKNTGDMQERTEWHRVVFFGKLAEIAGEYLRKGSKVYIDGRLQTRKWQEESGQDRYTTEIVAGDMQMLDGRQGGTAPGSRTEGATNSRPPPQSSAAGGNQNGGNGPPANDFDDDIPFKQLDWRVA